MAATPEPSGTPAAHAPFRCRPRGLAVLLAAPPIAVAALLAVGGASGAARTSVRPGIRPAVSGVQPTRSVRQGPRLPPTEEAVCRRLQALQGPLRLAGHRNRLTVLATGDSMIYPILEMLAVGAPEGMRVVPERYDGTGLTTNTVNWQRLSLRQATKIRPDVTVISVGGRDGGIPLPNAQHQLVECCGAPWLSLYAGLLRPLVVHYLRNGLGRVLWLELPAPREAARAPLFEAVNEALRLVAAEFPGAMQLIPVNSVISPGGYQTTITFDGLTIHPRTADGIHLDHAGACVERSLLVSQMKADGYFQ